MHRIQSRVKFNITIFNPSIVTQVASVAANFQPDTASYFDNVPPVPPSQPPRLIGADCFRPTGEAMFIINEHENDRLTTKLWAEGGIEGEKGHAGVPCLANYTNKQPSKLMFIIMSNVAEDINCV